MRLLLRLALPTLLATSALAQAPDLRAPLPRDPQVIQGQLPNGVRYLVRRNTTPERRAELRLVVNAGSILEEDAQRGIAHFVEHMAFNGTRRFPKADIVNFLERTGMRFGADVNAYTSFDETVYSLQVPTDTARLVATGLDILEDWAGALSFDPAEMQRERGVVIEEWRTGRNASSRVQNQQLPVILHDSRYAERLPIGAPESLRSFTDSAAIAFYHDWYRPDLMTVIAVGDFEPKGMESAIRDRFSRLQPAEHPRPRFYAPVPDHDSTLVSIVTDKEYPNASVALLWLRPSDTVRTVGDLRRRLVSSFYDGMVNARFGEMSQRPNAPFSFAGAGRGPLVRTKNVYQLVAGVKESEFLRAADALLTEADRIARFGFTATELARRRTNYLRGLEQAYAEREKTSSAVFAGELANAALTGSPIIGIEQEQALTRALLPGITTAELNALAKSSFTDRNRVVLVAAPEKPDIKVPDARSMLAVFARSSSKPLTAFVDSTSDAPLLRALPTPGRIASERTLPETGILEWTLSNGARVLLKPTDFKADEVVFGAQSPGGTSLLSDRDLLDADLASIVVSVGGLGPFNQIALGKALTGKRAMVYASIGDVKETLQGSASARDLETLFQLAWMRMMQPRVDSVSYAAFKSQMKAVLTNQRNTPEAAFNDTVVLTLAQHHPRMRVFTPALLDSVDLGHALRLYRDRFADASGFTFFLVGNFKPETVRPLVERYLASLPALHRNEKPRDTGIRPPAGIVERTVRRGVEPKAQTLLVFTGACDYSFENRMVLDALGDLLEIRLREVLREDKSGTYGVSVNTQCSHIPYSRYAASISFGSAPERVDELVAAVFAVIDSVKAGAVSDSNIAKIREIPIRAHETSLTRNDAWLAAMMDADEDGRDQRDFLRAPSIISAIDRDRLRDAARRYLDVTRYARFTLLPENAPKQTP